MRKRWKKILCIGSIIMAATLLVIKKYINHSILEPVNTIQEWLDVSLWRNISSGIYIIALSILLINMAYFLIQKKYKWLAVIQIC